jgi:hypothetical protein
MGGGLMQLVAYGAQDVYLSGNPQITFFKVVYRRHTNFSVEPIEQTWNGTGDFGKTVTCNINRNGDLITNMYCFVNLNGIAAATVAANYSEWGYVRRLGHAMIDNYKIEIGGSLIDQHYGDWLNIWYELTHKTGQERGYAKMIGDIHDLTAINNTGKREYKLYIPLQFWFNRNNGLALPLIALQYHDVRITVVFRTADLCVNWNGDLYSNKPPSAFLPSMQNCTLLIDYVYLDSEERKRFAQASHEYLIEQLQFTGSEALSTTNKYRLNFNHPCKYLIWAPHLDRYYNRNSWISYAYDGDWTAAKDRFAKMLFIATRARLGTAPTAAVAAIPASGSSPAVPAVPASLGGVFTSASTNLFVDGGSGGTAASAPGDLFIPQLNPNFTSNAFIKNLLSKIDVRCVAQSSPTTVGSNTVVQILNGVTTLSNTALLQELLNNLVVTQNNLTMEDISARISDLLTIGSFSTDTNLSSTNVLNLAQIQIIDYNNYGNFIDGSDNPVWAGKLQLNGHDRFQMRDGNYFNYVQPLQHFSNTPADGINVYSFALKAEDHQPSGSCNFSRIDNATLLVDVGLYNQSSSLTNNPNNTSMNYGTYYIGNNSNSLLNIYTMNYNVLRVMSGMAGTAYSN